VVELRRLLASYPDGQPIRLSQLRTALGYAKARLAYLALDEFGLAVDDTVPGIRAWIDRQADAIPVGFRDEVRAWLLVLLEGDERARPRSEATLYAYFGRVRPHLLAWARIHAHLREVTEDDISTVLNGLKGHRLAGTFTSLRSLFQFAKRRRLIFADPTRRFSVGRAPRRDFLPMTDEEIAAVKEVAVTPDQRLVIALAAVYAARGKAIRELTLDDIDLAGRRITISGHRQRLTEFVHRVVVMWLKYRHRRWPHTPNRHVLVSRESALGTGPINDYYLTWHLLLHGVQLEQIRGDRILREALAVDADPLHLVTAFNLSSQTAIDYADIAQSLLERPIETAEVSSGTAAPTGRGDEVPSAGERPAALPGRCEPELRGTGGDLGAEERC
jgi:integrase